MLLLFAEKEHWTTDEADEQHTHAKFYHAAGKNSWCDDLCSIVTVTQLRTHRWNTKVARFGASKKNFFAYVQHILLLFLGWADLGDASPISDFHERRQQWRRAFSSIRRKSNEETIKNIK